jgi:hypothetical protein
MSDGSGSWVNTSTQTSTSLDVNISGKLNVGEGSINSGDDSTAIGYNVESSGLYSIAMGHQTIASGSASIAMGSGTNVSGYYGSGFGWNTIVSGLAGVAMGRNTTASGEYGVAMGYDTVASGDYAVALGREIEASGDYSFAISLDDMNGAEVTTDNTMAIMGGNVGIGTVSPGHKLEVNGNISASYFKGDGSLLTGVGGGNSSFNQTLTDGLYSDVEWGYNQTTATYNLYNDDWSSTYNATYNSLVSGNSTFNQTLTDNLYADIKWGYNQTYSGSTYNATYDAKVTDNESWSESLADTLYSSIDAIGSSGGWINDSVNTTTSLSIIGNENIMVGYNVFASGDYSQAFGYNSKANGMGDFAAGYNTTANGDEAEVGGAFAIGYNTRALDAYSVAMGDRTTASGLASVAMGSQVDVSGQASVGFGSDISVTNDNTVGIGGYLQMFPRAELTCSSTTEGMIYYNTVANKHYACNSTDWKQLDSENIWKNNGGDIYYESGNVGIGTVSPDYPLDVAGYARIGNPSTTEQHLIIAADSYPVLEFRETGGKIWQIIQENTGDLTFRDGGAGVHTVMSLQKDGRVKVVGDVTGNVCPYNKFGDDTWERSVAGSNQAMALGNGDVLQGIVMPCAGVVTVITGTCENCASGTNEIAMELRINGVSQTCDTAQLTGTTAAGVYSIVDCSVAYSAGDRVGCYTKTETGAVTGLTCHMEWQNG